MAAGRRQAAVTTPLLCTAASLGIPGCSPMPALQLRPCFPQLRCSEGRRARRAPPAAATARQQQEQPDPYRLLQVDRGSSRRAIRAAYIERIKLLHPDVAGDGQDTTLQAAALNAAYERLMAGGRVMAGVCVWRIHVGAFVWCRAEIFGAAFRFPMTDLTVCLFICFSLPLPAAGFGSNSRDEEEEEEDDPLAVFDLPEAEPDRLFVNPFAAYNISPLQARWQGGSEGARQQRLCSVHVAASFQ